MEQTGSPPIQETPFVAELLALVGDDALGHIGCDGRAPIAVSVIRRLKNEVAQAVRSDVHRAVKLAELTRLAASRCDDLTGKALADHASALALHFSGRYDEALGLYEQAQSVYRQAGQEVEAARIGRAMVDVLMLLSEYERALDVAAQARTVFEDNDQPILLAQLETNVGNIYHRLDQYREALKFYDRAAEICAEHHDEVALAFINSNRANQYTCLDEFESALALYQAARQMFETADMPLAVNDVEYSIAWLYYRRGRFHESLRLFTRVRERARQLGDTTLDALCDLDLSEVYLQLNAYDDAIESAQTAAAKFAVLQREYEHIKARMYLGIAHLQRRDLETAEQVLQEARNGFIAEGNHVFTALTDIYLSEVLMRQRRWTEAVTLCADAKERFVQQGLPVKAAHAELQLARLELALGHIQEARRLCESVMRATDGTEAADLQQQVFHLLGNVMQQLGQTTEAYHCYRQAIEHLETLRSSIRVDEYKCTFLRDKLRVYEEMVQLCLQAGAAEKIGEAYSYAEAAKSRSLVDLLAASRAIRGKSSDAVRGMHQQWQNLREQLDWFYNRINECEWRSQPRPDRLIHGLRQEATRREQSLAKLMRQMRVEDAEYTSLQTVARPSVADIAQYLAADDVLVEYYIVGDRVNVFVIDGDGGCVCRDVTTVNAVVPLLRRLRFNLQRFTFDRSYINAHQNRVQQVMEQSLRLLHVELIEPIAPLLAGKRIFLVPHGVLHYVPFHALHDGTRYLIDQQEISYAPSASVLQLCVDKANQARESWIVDRGSKDESRITNHESRRALIMGVPDEAMPFVANEVEMLASLWPDARVFMGAEATLDRLKEHAPHCRFLHLASHGVFRRDNPMFSGLRLSDSWLGFYDVFNLQLNAELVTLSACETGINEVFPGDELFGLLRGFLYAGAPSLLVSLWIVHDGSTAQLMRLFYAGLKQGLTKRAALRQAQLGVKETYPHPYYWAPFILMGAP